MSVREITYLRKSGRLQEALEMAKQELDNDPNEWTHMSMFWVLRDMILNIYIPQGNTEQAAETLHYMETLLPYMKDDDLIGEKSYKALCKSIFPYANEIKELSDLSKTDPIRAYNSFIDKFGSNPNIDKSFHEDYGWIIYRYLKSNTSRTSEAISILNTYSNLSIDKPSLLHSVMLNYALSFSKENKDFSFYNFFSNSGIENLRDEDCEEAFYNGKRTASFLYRICSAMVESGDSIDYKEMIAEYDEAAEYFRQAYFWKLVNLNKESRTIVLLKEFDNYASAFSVYGGSHWHSEILKIANRYIADNDNRKFFEFFKKWYGEGNFTNDDWKQESDDEGNKYTSLAVKTAKRVFKFFESSNQLRNDSKAIAWLKELYTIVKERNKDDDWSIRNYATICIWSGFKDEAIAVYKDLLLHMGEKFYLWFELAYCLQDDYELCLGLLLKSKSLEKNEDYLGDVHLALAHYMFHEGYVVPAKKELSLYAQHRERKSWKLSNTYEELNKQIDSYSQGCKQIDCSKLIEKAEDYVYSLYDLHNCVLTKKWKNEGIEYCNFTDGASISFSVKSKRFPLLKKASAGDVFKARCYKREQSAKQSLLPSRMNSDQKPTIIPLCFKHSDADRWSELPIKYGYVNSINTEKHILHIITQDSKQTNCPVFSNAMVGSFVKFREYMWKRDSKDITSIANVELCNKEEALQNMRTRVVVVDDVNDRKELFHIILGMGLIGGIVRYNQTSIRPRIGDLLRLVYCVKENKEGNKTIVPLDIQETDETNESLVRQASGLLKMKYKRDNYSSEPDFAFIDDLYVHGNILRELGISEDCTVAAKAVLSNEGKWKVYELTKL